MEKKTWTFVEVIEIFGVDEDFLTHLEAEEIIHPVLMGEPPCKCFSLLEVEKLRVARILVEEMGVNLEGVEVILQMRQNMLEMRKQFDAILEDLAKRMEEAFHRGLPH
jgi:MerR family transcriptional regulator, heat shock protein HspR